MWKKHKNYVATLLIVSLLTIATLWYLQLNPQQLPYFLLGPLIALILIALFALKPEFGKRLFESILRYDAKRKKLGGWSYRYQNIALVLFFLIVLTYPVLWEYKLVPSQYTAFVVLTFFIVVVALGGIQIAGLLKIAGKWGLLFIVILTVMAVLRIWISGVLR